MTEMSIPAEFEAFAREQVAAGRYASEGEVVADALRQYLADREDRLVQYHAGVAGEQVEAPLDPVDKAR